MLAAGAVEAGEDLPLELEVLEHRLDHQVGVRGYVLVAHDSCDAALDPLGLLGAEYPPLESLLEERVYRGMALVHPLLLPVDHLDGESLRSALLGYPGAHIACSYYRDRLYHGPSGEMSDITPTEGRSSISRADPRSFGHAHRGSDRARRSSHCRWSPISRGCSGRKPAPGPSATMERLPCPGASRSRHRRWCP